MRNLANYIIEISIIITLLMNFEINKFTFIIIFVLNFFVDFFARGFLIFAN